MSAKSMEKPRMPHRHGHLVLAVAIAFVCGFLCGVVATVLRMEGKGNETAAGAPEHGTARMVQALEQHAAENPEHVDVWIQLGNLYFDQDMPEKAVNAYEKALQLDPGNSDVTADLGVMYRRQGAFQKAIDALDRAIVLNTGNDAARFNKGIVLWYDLNRKADALAVWRDLLDRSPLFMAPDGRSLDEWIKQHAPS